MILIIYLPNRYMIIYFLSLSAVRSLRQIHTALTSWFLIPSLTKMEAVTNFIFFCTKNAMDVDCSHEIKRHLSLGRKAMKNLVY